MVYERVVWKEHAARDEGHAAYMVHDDRKFRQQQYRVIVPGLICHVTTPHFVLRLDLSRQAVRAPLMHCRRDYIRVWEPLMYVLIVSPRLNYYGRNRKRKSERSCRFYSFARPRLRPPCYGGAGAPGATLRYPPFSQEPERYTSVFRFSSSSKPARRVRTRGKSVGG